MPLRKTGRKKSGVKPRRTTRRRPTRKKSSVLSGPKALYKRGVGRKRKATRSKPPAKRQKTVRKDPAPPQRKSTSSKATGSEVFVNPKNKEQVMKTLRKPQTVQKIDAKRIAKVKSLFSKSKEHAKKIGKGIEKTAKFVGKVATAIEPFLDAAAARNPENPMLLTAAGVDTLIAETQSLINQSAHNASRGIDAYAQRTEEGKLRKIMGTGGAPSLPQITMMDEIPHAAYPPLPRHVPSAYGVIEEID